MTLESQTSLSPDAPIDTPPSSTATPADASQQTPASAEKPSWLFDDALFDADKGVKVDELGARAKELHDKFAEQERVAAERKADIPAKAEEYGFTLPEGYKLPEGLAVDEKSPLWKSLQDVALARGLTRKEYAEVAAKFMDGMGENYKAQMKQYEAARDEMFTKALGSNSAEVVEAAKKQADVIAEAFGGSSDKKALAEQIRASFWTPDLVKLFVNIGKAISTGGVPSFNGAGREEPDNKPDGWEKMTFAQRWQYAANKSRSGG